MKGVQVKGVQVNDEHTATCVCLRCKPDTDVRRRLFSDPDVQNWIEKMWKPEARSPIQLRLIKGGK